MNLQLLLGEVAQCHPLAYLSMSVHLAFQPILYKEGTLVTVSLSIDIFRSDTEQGTPRILSTQLWSMAQQLWGLFPHA